MTGILIDAEFEVLAAGDRRIPLYSDEAFGLLSDLWLKIGWNQRYAYGFEWRGRQILQHPEDLIRAQMAIWKVRPTVIVETGIAHGGSLLFWADMLALVHSSGLVIGVERGILPDTRDALSREGDDTSSIIVIEGNSAASETAAMVDELIKPRDTVMVFLDSNHCRDHVSAELELYSSLVTVGSYIVVCDGITGLLHDVPRGSPDWQHDNPREAVKAFLAEHGDHFRAAAPPMREGGLPAVTQWPDGWIERIS